jgi:hypothetical protein
VTCASYAVEDTAASEADSRSLSPAERDKVETHLAALRQAPFPAPTNKIRRHRAELQESLPPGFEGPFWTHLDTVLVFHAVHPEECRVILLWLVGPKDLRLT